VQQLQVLQDAMLLLKHLSEALLPQLALLLPLCCPPSAPACMCRLASA
jgi:hypothetical protein